MAFLVFFDNEVSGRVRAKLKSEPAQQETPGWRKPSFFSALGKFNAEREVEGKLA